MAHDLDNQNTITTPTGEVIVLAPGAPRSLESHFGLLVSELRHAYESWLAAAEEACRSNREQKDDGRRGKGFNLTPIVDPDLLFTHAGRGFPDRNVGGVD